MPAPATQQVQIAPRDQDGGTGHRHQHSAQAGAHSAAPRSAGRCRQGWRPATARRSTARWSPRCAAGPGTPAGGTALFPSRRAPPAAAIRAARWAARGAPPATRTVQTPPAKRASAGTSAPPDRYPRAAPAPRRSCRPRTKPPELKARVGERMVAPSPVPLLPDSAGNGPLLSWSGSVCALPEYPRMVRQPAPQSFDSSLIYP